MQPSGQVVAMGRGELGDSVLSMPNYQIVQSLANHFIALCLCSLP